MLGYHLLEQLSLPRAPLVLHFLEPEQHSRQFQPFVSFALKLAVFF